MFLIAKDRWVQILSLRAASSVPELHTNHEPVQNGGRFMESGARQSMARDLARNVAGRHAHRHERRSRLTLRLFEPLLRVV